MDADLECMSTSEIAQCMKSAQLELAYERALRQAERIYEEERVRALRVQLLLLEDENDEIQEQAAKAEDEQSQLEDTNEELRIRLSEVEADFQQTQVDLKARLRDLDHLKAEVNALNAASSDATKILAEKLALARELNVLKPELEHLKSQTSTQQNLLSDKLALQREVSSLQVELDTEKRAVQRLKAQEKSASREDSALAQELEELRKDLTKTQRDAQKADRENRKKYTQWESEKELLEGKLDAFRNKLRSTKDQLKEAQDEIEKLQAAKMAQSTEMTKARLNGAAAGNPRKRNVARFDPDMTIGTPGHGGHAAKKQRISVNVGDKSNFSITPFLNRTLSILPETPAEDADESEREDKRKRSGTTKGAVEEPGAESKNKATKGKQEKGSAARKQTTSSSKAKATQPLKESTNSKANSKVMKPQLDKLVEVDSDLESDKQDLDFNADDDDDRKENTDHTENTNFMGQDRPEKKAKNLTKRANIFDEEDTAPTSKIRGLGRGLLGGAALARVNLKAKPGKTLAEFSPLKKDRRVVGIVE